MTKVLKLCIPCRWHVHRPLQVISHNNRKIMSDYNWVRGQRKKIDGIRTKNLLSISHLYRVRYKFL